MIKLIIFDLDGTLLNTLDDLASCTNYVLQKNGYSIHEIDSYKYFVGNGTEILLRRALPKEVNETEFIKIFHDFMNYYELHKADKTAPYGGIIQTLEKLHKKGILLTVATNKSHHLLPELIKYYFPNIQWAAVFGNRKGVPLKPHPQIVHDILETCTDVVRMGSNKICKNEILYVGDTAVDMDTAKNAGIIKVGVLWGFRTREELQQANADYIIEHPHELLKISCLN